MKEERLNILIDKELRGICSPDEKTALEAWLSESEANKAQYAHMSRIIHELQTVPFDLNPETDAQWSNLQKTISRQDSKEVSGAKIVHMGTYRRLWRIAVMVVLAIGLGWLTREYFMPADFEVAQTYSVQKGQTKSLNLPDGSVVYLNADSKLSVFEKFNQKNRLLSLEGEAFFDVAKNRKLPFVIQTGAVSTEVTGTAFNLSAYPESDNILLSVVEGEVNFKTENQIISVPANVAAAYHKPTNEISQTEFDSEKALGWREGRLILDNVPTKDALKAIERRFDVRFNDLSGVSSIRLIINKEDDLDGVLRSLEDIMSVTATREGEVIKLIKK